LLYTESQKPPGRMTKVMRSQKEDLLAVGAGPEARRDRADVQTAVHQAHRRRPE